MPLLGKEDVKPKLVNLQVQILRKHDVCSFLAG